MTGRRLSTALSCILVAALACDDDSPTTPSVPEEPPPVVTADPANGELAFLGECASCHAARDGFDVAFFDFPDSTIVRRAVAHVDSVTAHDIAAYINTLDVDPVARDFRVFQPDGEPLPSDIVFAQELFGADEWPADLTSDELRALDPRGVQVAISFPMWSSEESNLDWMPEEPVPSVLLDYRFGSALGSLDFYYRHPSDESLVQAVRNLRIADQDPNNPDAPCVIEPEGRFQAQECFEVRRWTSSLVAQHMIRYGVDQSIHPIVHDVWWDVGNAARKARQQHQVFENTNLNWATWMYLGWAFEPDRHASVYLGSGLIRIGLFRHATFVALRSAVGRERGSAQPYFDVANAARFAPQHWTLEATRFGYEELLARLESGELPGARTMDEARHHVTESFIIVRRRLPAEQAAELEVLKDRILSYLP